MADYDSESSAEGEDIETNVLLGYASTEPTGDDFSQIGGRPIWLDGNTPPSSALTKCRVCKRPSSLLLQLNGDLPDWFPGHERRLYLFGCRRKACRRKDGSIRAVRAVRISRVEGRVTHEDETTAGSVEAKPAPNIGEALFGGKSQSSVQSNPFAPNPTPTALANPFSTQKLTTAQSSSSSSPAEAKLDSNLPETFAQKARVSTSSISPRTPSAPFEPWQEDPTPYPSHYIDAEKEYLEPRAEAVPSTATLDTAEDGSNTAAEEKALFESSMDKTFQSFADRLSQNPEQVLRYEFTGQPLLYTKSDTPGKLFSSASNAKVQTSSSSNGSAGLAAHRIPRCPSCGAARVFELQLTPHAITELEKEELSIDGMDWGTVILGVCSQDCVEGSKDEGDLSYLEEWVGVQWEEVVASAKK